MTKRRTLDEDIVLLNLIFDEQIKSKQEVGKI